MATRNLHALLDGIRFLGHEQYSIVESVRALVKSSFPDTVEEAEYGGTDIKSLACYGLRS
jgi:hypothetical protein